MTFIKIQTSTLKLTLLICLRSERKSTKKKSKITQAFFEYYFIGENSVKW